MFICLQLGHNKNIIDPCIHNTIECIIATSSLKIYRNRIGVPADILIRYVQNTSPCHHRLGQLRHFTLTSPAHFSNDNLTITNLQK